MLNKYLLNEEVNEELLKSHAKYPTFSMGMDKEDSMNEILRLLGVQSCYNLWSSQGLALMTWQAWDGT